MTSLLVAILLFFSSFPYIFIINLICLLEIGEESLGLLELSGLNARSILGVIVAICESVQTPLLTSNPAPDLLFIQSFSHLCEVEHR